MLSRTRRRVRRIGLVLLDHTGTHVLLVEDPASYRYGLPEAVMDEATDCNFVYTAFRAYVNATRLQMPALETRTMRHFTAEDGTEFLVAHMTTPWTQYLSYMLSTSGRAVAPVQWLAYASDDNAVQDALPHGVLLSSRAQAQLAFMRTIPSLEPRHIQATLHTLGSHPHTVHGRQEPGARIANGQAHYLTHSTTYDLGDDSRRQLPEGSRRHYTDLCIEIRDAVSLVNYHRRSTPALYTYAKRNV